MPVALLLSVLLAALGPDRELAPRIPGVNPGPTSLIQLIPRPGGFTALYSDQRLRSAGHHVGLRETQLGSALELLDPAGVALPLAHDEPQLDTLAVAGVQSGAGLELFSQAVHSSLLSGVTLSATGWQIDGEALLYARTDESGALLRGPIEVASFVVPGPQLQVSYSLQAAHDGTRTLLAWLEVREDIGVNGGTLEAVRLATIDDATGALAGPWTVGTNDQPDETLGSLALVSSGGDTVLMWLVDRQNQTSVLEHVRLRSGAPGAAPAAATSLMSGLIYFPALVATGSGCFYLAWMAGAADYVGDTPPGTLAGATLDTNDRLGATVPLNTTSRIYSGLHLAFDGSDLRVLASSPGYSASSESDTFASTVPPAGSPGAEQPLPDGNFGFYDPPPDEQLACSGTACIAGWSPTATSLNEVGPATTMSFTRLAGDSTSLDVPPLEISFPADAESAPQILPDRSGFDALFLRTIGRGETHLALRRLTAQGADESDAGPLDLGQADRFAAAALPDGGLLVATNHNLVYCGDFCSSPTDVHGQLLSPSGESSDAGAWSIAAGDAIDGFALACAQSRCGLIFDNVTDYLLPYGATALDLNGQVVDAQSEVSTIVPGALLGFAAAGSRFVAVQLPFEQPLEALLADELAFPTFGPPIPIESPSDGGVEAFGAVTSLVLAAQGSRVAIIWADSGACRIWGRALESSTAKALGDGPVLLHDCGEGSAQVLSITPGVGGFSLLFADQSGGFGSAAPFWFPGSQTAATYLQETDLALAPTGPAQLLDVRKEAVEGLTLVRMGGQDAYADSRFDDSPGVSARRAELSLLDGGASLAVPDAGAPDDWVDVRSGCGCSSAQSVRASLAPLALLGVALAARRRRRT